MYLKKNHNPTCKDRGVLVTKLDIVLEGEEGILFRLTLLSKVLQQDLASCHVIDFSALICTRKLITMVLTATTRN